MAARRDAAARFVLTFAAFLALAWQGLLVQTHVHFDGPAQWQNRTAVSHIAPRLVRPRADIGKTSGCALCREQALSGSFTSPAEVGFLLAIATFTPPVAVALRSFRAPPRSHGWNSRAPPTARAVDR